MPGKRALKNQLVRGWSGKHLLSSLKHANIDLISNYLVVALKKLIEIDCNIFFQSEFLIVLHLVEKLCDNNGFILIENYLFLYEFFRYRLNRYSTVDKYLMSHDRLCQHHVKVLEKLDNIEKYIDKNNMKINSKYIDVELYYINYIIMLAIPIEPIAKIVITK